VCFGTPFSCVLLSPFRRDVYFVDGVLSPCVSVDNMCVGSPHTLATRTHVTGVTIYVTHNTVYT
jgi:hypothetical protein